VEVAERGEVGGEGNNGITTVAMITIRTKMDMCTKMARARSNRGGDRVQMLMKRCQNIHLRGRSRVRKVRYRIDESLKVAATKISAKRYCTFGRNDEREFGI